MPSSGGQTCALRSEEHTSELQSHDNIVSRLLLEKKDRDPPHMVEACFNAPARAPRPAAALDHEATGILSTKGLLGTLFFFNERATTEISTLPLRASVPI